MEITLKKVHSTKDLAISIFILVLGIILLFISVPLGVVVLIIGALMLAFYKSAYKATGSDTLLSKRAFDVASSCRTSIVSFLEGKSDELQIQHPAEGGSVRLEAYYNSKENVVYAELYDFSNYVYVPATPLTTLNGERAKKFISSML